MNPPFHKQLQSYGLAFLLAASFAIIPGQAMAAKVGDPAPAFSAQDSNGKTVSLAALKGKYVVLEWTNKDCPYVRKHYDSGNMQKLQKQWTAKGVSWLTILSSAPGTQGALTGAEANENSKKTGASPSALLMDPQGKVGNLYAAKTTPHIFLIDPKGSLIYEGAIDDQSSTDKEDIAKAKNYLTAALEESMAGKAVSTPTTRAYGCSVKYSKN